ncbi:MAG: ParA family protein, partial [Acidobacteriota bacterium]
SYRKLDLMLNEQKKPSRSLRRLLKPLSDDYDVVVLDCPPGLTLTNEVVFSTADVLLVPVVPNALTVRTLKPLAEHLDKRRRKGEAAPPMLPFFSMVDKRKSIHRNTITSPPKGFPFLTPKIPFSAKVERMEVERAPLVALEPASVPAVAFRNLWREAQARVSVAA